LRQLPDELVSLLEQLKAYASESNGREESRKPSPIHRRKYATGSRDAYGTIIEAYDVECAYVFKDHSSLESFPSRAQQALDRYRGNISTYQFRRNETRVILVLHWIL
jgi:hypothetical protein